MEQSDETYRLGHSPRGTPLVARGIRPADLPSAEKIEYVGGIFASDRERLNVLGMLLENLGIDRAIRFGKLEDWKAAIADLENKQGSRSQP